MNQDDNGMTKLGCVNHDCDKCKAQQQEPVPSIIQMLGHCPECGAKAHHFTSPPANANAGKPWVGLTNSDKLDLISAAKGIGGRIQGDGQLLALLDEHEAKLREKNAQPSKPLTDEQIEMMWRAGPYDHGTLYDFRLAARDTEAAHGITGEQK